MRAIKLTEIGTVREVETSRPQLQHGEVLINVTAAGVCKTDVMVPQQTPRSSRPARP